MVTMIRDIELSDQEAFRALVLTGLEENVGVRCSTQLSIVILFGHRWRSLEVADHHG